MRRPEACPVNCRHEPPPVPMTPRALEAERMAIMFGLGYLSAEAFHKLADLIAWCRFGAKPCPPGADED